MTGSESTGLGVTLVEECLPRVCGPGTKGGGEGWEKSWTGLGKAREGRKRGEREEKTTQ